MSHGTATHTYTPHASLWTYARALLEGKRIVCISANRLVRRSRRVSLFSIADTPQYYRKHAHYESRILAKCDAATPRDAFAYQHHLSEALVYLIPYHILSESHAIELVAPLRLKAPVFPEGTRYAVSVRDLIARLRRIRRFSRVHLQVNGEAAELASVPFNGSTVHPVRSRWLRTLRLPDLAFYRAAFDAQLGALRAATALQAVRVVQTRRWRDSVEYSENVAYAWCDATGRLSVGEQERAFFDFAVEYSFSWYHEFRYWDDESRRIHIELCPGNHVRDASVACGKRREPEPARAAGGAGAGFRILAFPWEITSSGFSNSAHADVHLAAEFAAFLRGLRDAGFSVTVKVKDPQDVRHFQDFECMVSERGGFLGLLPQFDYFVSCGYTTPGIELKTRGLRSYYFFPLVPGRRLYPAMTFSTARELVHALRAG